MVVRSFFSIVLLSISVLPTPSLASNMYCENDKRNLQGCVPPGGSVTSWERPGAGLFCSDVQAAIARDCAVSSTSNPSPHIPRAKPTRIARAKRTTTPTTTFVSPPTTTIAPSVWSVAPPAWSDSASVSVPSDPSSHQSLQYYAPLNNCLSINAPNPNGGDRMGLQNRCQIPIEANWCNDSVNCRFPDHQWTIAPNSWTAFEIGQGRVWGCHQNDRLNGEKQLCEH
jgi:hypothetical protein